MVLVVLVFVFVMNRLYEFYGQLTRPSTDIVVIDKEKGAIDVKYEFGKSKSFDLSDIRRFQYSQFREFLNHGGGHRRFSFAGVIELKLKNGDAFICLIVNPIHVFNNRSYKEEMLKTSGDITKALANFTDIPFRFIKNRNEKK